MKYIREGKKESTQKNTEHTRVVVAMIGMQWRIIRQITLCKRVQ